MTQPRILIVGAGPTGLTAAVELARLGIIPSVIEKRKDASNLSRAVGISPSSMNIFEPSGLAKAIRAEAIPFQKIILHHRAKILTEIDLSGGFGKNNHLFGLAQDRTETHLRDAFIKMGGEIIYDAEMLSLSQSEIGVSVSISGKAMRFDYVIGADGVNSAVRNAVHVSFNGFDLPEVWSIVDVKATEWPNPQAFQGFILDNGGVVVTVPLEKDRFRVIANSSDALAAIPVPMKVSKIRREANFKISIRQAETYQIGRVFLAGDAAHSHSPAGGRGMNLGIADAADLAQRFVNGTTDGYSAARHPIGTATIRSSELLRRALTSKHPISRFFIRSLLRIIPHVAVLRRRLIKNTLGL